jgi:predicted enzyme related to lactoylglutathione lyase
MAPPAAHRKPAKTKPVRAGRRKAGKSARKAAGKPQAGRSAPALRRHTPTQGVDGWITHTDLASDDPAATKLWASKVFGWAFRPPMPTPGGDLHLFVYSDRGGGAIRRPSPPETPGSIPYVHVDDVGASYAKALREGAGEMMSPTKVMEGVVVAIVRAPGGVPIGLSGGK